MCEIKKYLEAVAMRKMCQKKMSGTAVNYAVVRQIEDDDIPRLLEIIRLMDGALSEIMNLASDEEEISDAEAEKALRLAVSAHLKAEQVAAEGSKKRWGDYDPGEH